MLRVQKLANTDRTLLILPSKSKECPSTNIKWWRSTYHWITWVRSDESIIMFKLN